MQVDTEVMNGITRIASLVPLAGGLIPLGLAILQPLMRPAPVPVRIPAWGVRREPGTGR
jgi:hypothetical protein